MRMKLVGVVTALILCLAVPSSASASPTQGNCVPVGGVIRVALVTPGVTSGSIMLAGVFLATTYSQFTSGLLPTPDPNTYSYTAFRAITAKQGVIYLNEVGVYDLTKNVISAIDTITGGTGAFASATGTLVTNSKSYDGYNFSGVIGGSICGVV